MNERQDAKNAKEAGREKSTASGAVRKRRYQLLFLEFDLGVLGSLAFVLSSQVHVHQSSNCPPGLRKLARSRFRAHQIRIERDSSGYLGKVADLPTILGFGTSEEAALRTTREHLKWALAYLIETGRTPSPGNATPGET